MTDTVSYAHLTLDALRNQPSVRDEDTRPYVDGVYEALMESYAVLLEKFTAIRPASPWTPRAWQENDPSSPLTAQRAEGSYQPKTPRK